MKRIFVIWAIRVLLLGATVCLGFYAANRVAAKRQHSDQSKRLSILEAYTDDRSQNRLRPDENYPTVVVFFHSECEHCQYQIKQLAKQKELVKKVRIWLLSTESMACLNAFAVQCKIPSRPGVVIAHIEPEMAFKTIGFQVTPQILIYDSQGKLRFEFRGETKWETVSKWI